MPRDETKSNRLYDRNFALAISSQTCFVIANTLMAHYARWIDALGGNVRQVGWIMGAGAVLGLVLGLAGGLGLPGFAAQLKPWLPHLVALFLYLTALRIGARAALGRLAEARRTLGLVLLLQLALPLA